MRLERNRALCLAAVLAGVLAGHPPASLPASEAIEEGPERGVEGVVSLSTGEILRGRVRFVEGKQLRVYDLRARRVRSLEVSQVESIRTLVEDEKLEDAWTFEEGGSRKKVKLGWQYPLRSYRQEVALAGGQVIEGHCHAAVFFLRQGGEERKLVLPRAQRGNRGEGLDALVYPVTLQLGTPSVETRAGRSEGKDFARLEGELPGLSAIALVERASLEGYPARVGAGGKYTLAGLLPGEHGVFLRKGDVVITGFPERSTLPEADLASLRARIEKIAEFFDEKRIVSTLGPAESPRVLLELTRRRRSTLTREGGGAYAFRRWEVWAFRRRALEWTVEARIFLDRLTVPPERKLEPCTYRSVPALEGLRLQEGANSLPPLDAPKAFTESSHGPCP